MSTAYNNRTEFSTSQFVRQTAIADVENVDAGMPRAYRYFGCVLDTVGELYKKRVLDVGFGTGQLARTLDLLGAEVSAIDNANIHIPLLRQMAPSIAWWQEDINTWTLPFNADPFDVIVAVDTLQYVEFVNAAARLLAALAPGGRLVMVVPNADCPREKERLGQTEHRTVAVSTRELPGKVCAIINHDVRLRSRRCRVFYRGVYCEEIEHAVPAQHGPWVEATPGADLSVPSIPAPHFFKEQTPSGLQIVFNT